MYLFDAQCKLKKYLKIENIIDDYYSKRLDMYQKRKDYLLNEMEKELLLLSNRARYILEILEGKMDLRKKTKDEIHTMLESHQFDKMDQSTAPYEYLVKMRMDSVSKENVERILKERDETQHNLSILREKSIQTIWLEELNELEKEYDKYKLSREVIQKGEIQPHVIKVVKTVKKKVPINPPTL